VRFLSTIVLSRCQAVVSGFACYRRFLRARLLISLALAGALLLGGDLMVWAVMADQDLVGMLHKPSPKRVEQDELSALVVDGQEEEAFKRAFELGDVVFETVFNALDGSGAHVGRGLRFTRIPRADLMGSAEWAYHYPARETGPNAQSCDACHSQPMADGAGSTAANVVRDPLHTGNISSFITRNTPHLFGIGAIQRLAEELTETLQDIREKAQEKVCQSGSPASVELSAKGIDFGTIIATPTTTSPCTANIDTSDVRGVAPDLVVRPFQWKGSFAFLRDFNRRAAHNELGMQPVELVGAGVDGDYDGVVDEMTVGDQTALTIYLAAQPRPTTRVELASLGLIAPLPAAELRAIERGAQVFGRVGCAECHMPSLTIDHPIFSEPSQHPDFRDRLFPGGQDPLAWGVAPEHPVTFDLTRDQPDNHIKDADGNVISHLGRLEKDSEGRAIVRLFGDLKRHDMGVGLAEPIDEVGTGASVFLTENLWGVGSTAPYLHDGRATTLAEAIGEHGGAAAPARAAFLDLPTDAQMDLITFLNNLVLFKVEEKE
jgi:mono/diheme cytochrome c family protein